MPASVRQNGTYRRPTGGPGRVSPRPCAYVFDATAPGIQLRVPAPGRPIVVPDPDDGVARTVRRAVGTLKVVVAACKQRPVRNQPVVPSRPTWLDGSTDPIGVQHAAPATHVDGTTRVALCGAELTGWIIFGGRPFEVGDPESCPPCVQSLSGRRNGSPEGAGKMKPIDLVDAHLHLSRSLDQNEITWKQFEAQWAAALGAARRQAAR